MRRTEVLQEIRLMKFEEIYGPTRCRALSQAEAASVLGMSERARQRVAEILSANYPTHIGGDLDAAIRDRFPIMRPREAMRPGNGRW